MADERQIRPPRGALIVIAIGLLATVAAALLTSDKSAGAVALEWEVEQRLPDSKPVSVPGGGGKMQLVEAGLRGTGRNVSGYQLYRSAATLSIDRGAPVGAGRVICTIRVPAGHTIVAHTPSNRGSYPRPSEEEDLVKQEVPEQVKVEFTAHGTDGVIVELGDAFDEFVAERGVTVSWVPFRIGRQGWQWGLPPGRPSKQLDLGFASIWRTTGTPTARIACTLTTSAGSASVATGGSLPAKAAPLAE